MSFLFKVPLLSITCVCIFSLPISFPAYSATTTTTCDLASLRHKPETTVQLGGCGRISSRLLSSSQLMIKTDFGNSYISPATFTNYTIKKSSFKGSMFLYPNFSGADIKDSDFSDADLRSVQFIYTRIEKTKFGKANLTRAFFHQCELRDLDLSQANLQGASFNQCRLINVKLPDNRNYSLDGNTVE